MIKMSSVIHKKLKTKWSDVDNTVLGYKYVDGVEEEFNDDPVTVHSTLDFTSPSTFSLTAVDISSGSLVPTKGWDGVLEYTTNGIDFIVWNGSEIIAGIVNGSYYIGVRGTSNTFITFDVSLGLEKPGIIWYMSGSDIRCTGNIELLLDYRTVLLGGHPLMAPGCYYMMFYHEPLVSAPVLPALTLTQGCYMRMFSECTSLTVVPKLPSTTLANKCYTGMFNGCTSLKVSSSFVGSYAHTYRIPTSGTGVTAADALTDMFSNTGGTFTGTPTINTDYYMENEPV